MNTLDSLMMRPRTKPQTPSMNLATILNGPVVSIQDAITAVMLDSNTWMLVNAANQAVWASA
jgi:hypothetical protein